MPCPVCNDGVQNGHETDIDCGGAGCPACPAGGHCQGPGDCQSGICTTGVCQDASCTDGLQDGTETGIDCGGPSCARLRVRRRLQHRRRLPERRLHRRRLPGADLRATACDNGAETDVDCGGAAAPRACRSRSRSTRRRTASSRWPRASTVTGHTTGVGPAGADLTINGAPVPLAAGRHLLDHACRSAPPPIFNPIHARLARHFDGQTAYDRVVVIAGAVDRRRQRTRPNGVAMRINDRGLDSIEPVATTLVDIDPATLVHAGHAW